MPSNENVFSTFSIKKQGAEARIFHGTYLGKPAIVKDRFVKKYRHASLDEHLTKERMKAEARAILRCKAAGVATPAVYFVDFVRRLTFMEYVLDCLTAKDFIDALMDNKKELTQVEHNLDVLSREIGSGIARMHTEHIIHGDLTTSNILVQSPECDAIPTKILAYDSISKIYFIDFGLSFSSQTAEDKAVDLYVLERAILSAHEDSDKLFGNILKAYMEASEEKKPESGKEVLKKLDEVRLRGRKRSMVG